MHRNRPAKRLRPGLGKAEEAHLAFRDELRHRADGFFDGRVRINTVLIVEVNVIGTQTPQAAFAGLPSRTPAGR